MTGLTDFVSKNSLSRFGQEKLFPPGAINRAATTNLHSPSLKFG